MANNRGDGEEKNCDKRNSIALFGLDPAERDKLKERFLSGKCKLRSVMDFYGVNKKEADAIVDGWKRNGSI
jgi:hypothetical protein